MCTCTYCKWMVVEWGGGVSLRTVARKRNQRIDFAILQVSELILLGFGTLQ